MDIELWIQESLGGWLRNNMGSHDAWKSLAGLIQDYTITSGPMYAESAEDTSLMLLAVMDLWVALDKFAVHQYPLLKEDDSGFPSSLFDPLPLLRKNQLERLTLIEQYIQAREDESAHYSALVFRKHRAQMLLSQVFWALS
jgi:hypothetical protein